MEEKKSPASAAESAASGQPAAVPAAELRPGRRKFPTVGDLFAMLGIAFGAQIVVGTAAMVFLLFAGHGLDFKSLEPAALGKVMAALYFCSMSITLAGILCYRRARGGSGPWARFSARGLNPALLLWAFVLMFAVGVVLEPLLRLMPELSLEVGRGFWTILSLVVGDDSPCAEQRRGLSGAGHRARQCAADRPGGQPDALRADLHRGAGALRRVGLYDAAHAAAHEGGGEKSVRGVIIRLRTALLTSKKRIFALRNMNLRAKIAVAAGVLLLAGCRELPRYFAGDTTIARAGGKDLRLGDVRSVVPQGLSGDDSAAFMKVYIDRWVLKQLKLQEAETLFSSSAGDIDKMVEEYRQALLIRQLDQHYVDRSIDTVFTADEIAAYYNAHKADFKLDRTIVKGRIVRFGEGYRQAAKLKTLMGARSEAQQQDFRDICEKNDFTVDDFRDQWIDFPEFLSYLPTLRSQSYDSVLATAAVQEMRDSHAHYYFQIDAVLREGEPIPLERLRGTIRRILFNQRKGEIIRAHEEELCARASEMGEVKIFADEKPKKDE